jgi:hypothetical protein
LLDLDMRQNVCPSHHRAPVGRFPDGPFAGWTDADTQAVFRSLPAPRPSASTDDWQFILDTFAAYSNRNAANPHSSILSHQMYLIATLSYEGRREAGGWAGDFVKFTFLYAARSVAADPGFWDNPPGTEEHALWPHGSNGDYLFSASRAGAHHFDRHLAPAFYQYIRDGFDRILRESRPQDRLANLTAFVNVVTAEHEAFLRNAVLPACGRVRAVGNAFGNIERVYMRNDVAASAQGLRRNTFDRVTLELVQQGRLTGDERLRLLAVAGINIMPPHP